MAEKLIKVKNTKDRYFNGARKNGILKVPEKDVEYYKKHGFVVVGEEIKAIVEGEGDNKKEITKDEIIKKLEEYGVEFNKRAKKEELEKLLQEVEGEGMTED